MRNKIEFDVIIVGAGLSGLTAAHTLLEEAPSLHVLVLEATDRVGGRLLSKPLACKDGNEYSCYDFGGQFIRASNACLLELLAKLNLNPVLYHTPSGKHIVERKDGKISKTSSHNPFAICNLIDRFQLFRFFLRLEEMCENVCFSSPYKYEDLDKVTLEMFMRRWFMSERARNVFRTMVLASCGVETTEISVLFYLAVLNSTRGLEFLRKEDVFFIEGGTEEICSNIVRKHSRNIVIKCNTTVKEIVESDDGEIIVETATNTYYCSYIIVAVQTCALKTISFHPELPEEGALGEIFSGRLAKFVVTYQTAFWQKKGFSGTVLSCADGPILMCCDVTKKERPALSGLMYNSGDQDEVLKQLAKYFGKETLVPVDFYIKQWNDTGSPTCCLGLNTLKDCSENFWPDNRIFWASAEVTDYFYGHMEGAVHSGYKAATQVLFACRPSAINFRHLVKMSEPDLTPFFHYKDSLTAYFINKKVVIIGLVLFTYLAIRKLKYNKLF